MDNKKISFLVVTNIVIFTVFILAYTKIIEFNQSPAIQNLFELSGFFISMFVFLMTFVSFYNKKQFPDLFMSVCFLGLAILHMFNFLITSDALLIQLPSFLSAIIKFNWITTSSYLAFFFFITYFFKINKIQNIITITKKLTHLTFLFSIIMAFLVILVSLCVPLNNLFYLHFEMFAFLLFATSSVMAIISEEKVSMNLFYIIIALMVLIISQASMFLSDDLFDNMYSIANALKMIAYIILFVATLHNIFQVYKREKAIEFKMNQIFNYMPVGVISVDINGDIETANELFCNIFNYGKHQLIGVNIKELVPDVDKLQNYKYTQICNKIDTIGLKQDGEKFDVEVGFNKINMEENEFFVYSFLDITERKKIDIMKNEFISVVSHELKTPITSIKGGLALLAMKGINLPEEKKKDLLTIAYNNTLRLQELVGNILNIEQLNTGKMSYSITSFDIMPLINQAIREITPYADQYKVEIKLDDKPDTAIMIADQQKVLQVLINFLSNAIKFSSQNEAVKVSVVDNKEIIKVSVIDKGIGIDVKDHDKLFKRFSQVDSSDTRKFDGTGLGLNICKELIEGMSGKIGFESALNKGSTFYFELPSDPKVDEDE